MLIGLISDIHANFPALRAALETLDLWGGIDEILCAGDLTGYHTQPNEVMAELDRRQVRWIAGNHDVYLREPPPLANAVLSASLAFTRGIITPAYAQLLAAAPCQMHLERDGLRIAMFHGSPWNPQEQYIYPDFQQWDRFAEVDADVIVLGHTHRPFIRHVAGRLIVNPGSVGQPRDGDPRAACAILNTATRQVELVRAAFDYDAVARSDNEAGLGYARASQK